MNKLHSELSPWPYGLVVKTNRETGNYNEEQLSLGWREAEVTAGGEFPLDTFIQLLERSAGTVREGGAVGRSSQPSCVILDSPAPGPKFYFPVGKTRSCNEQSPASSWRSLACPAVTILHGILRKRKRDKCNFWKILIYLYRLDSSSFIHSTCIPFEMSFSSTYRFTTLETFSARTLLKLTLCSDK